MYRLVINKKLTSLYQEIINLPLDEAYISNLHKKLIKLEDAYSFFPSGSRINSAYRFFDRKIFSNSLNPLKTNLEQVQNVLSKSKIGSLTTGNISQLEEQEQVLQNQKTVNEIIEPLELLLLEIGLPQHFITRQIFLGHNCILRETAFNDVKHKVEKLIMFFQELLSSMNEYYTKIKAEQEKNEETFKQQTYQLQMLVQSQKNENQVDYEQKEKLLKEIEVQTRLCQEEQARLQEQQKQYAKEEAIRLEEAKKIALKEFPFTDHLEGCIQRIGEVTEEQLKGTLHTRMVKAYKAIEDTLKRFKLVPVEKLALIPQDVERLNQIEAILDMYDEKIRKVRKDDSLAEEEREDKIEYWKRLRDRDIAMIEDSQ